MSYTSICERHHSCYAPLRLFVQIYTESSHCGPYRGHARIGQWGQRSVPPLTGGLLPLTLHSRYLAQHWKTTVINSLNQSCCFAPRRKWRFNQLTKFWRPLEIQEQEIYKLAPWYWGIWNCRSIFWTTPSDAMSSCLLTEGQKYWKSSQRLATFWNQLYSVFCWSEYSNTTSDGLFLKHWQ